jgi:hypothetical protein
VPQPGARRPFALLLISVGLTTMVGAACSHGTTTAAPRPALFEMREVVATQVGRDALATHPFTTGVIRANDPYRHDPAFAEAPPGAAGDLVTYADTNGDGFYTPGRDPKFLLGPAAITAADVRTAKAAQIQGRWTVEVGLDAAGIRTLGALTARLVGRQIAFVFDRLVISAPTIQTAITSGQVAVTGNLDQRRAGEIASALEPA